MSRRWLHRRRRRKRSFPSTLSFKKKFGAGCCCCLSLIPKHIFGTEEKIIYQVCALCVYDKWKKRGFAFGMSVLQPLLSHFLSLSPISIIFRHLLCAAAFKCLYIHCTKIKTSLHLMCVDYVCQWGRLKVIICGLRLNKCAFYLLFYTHIPTHTHRRNIQECMQAIVVFFVVSLSLSLVPSSLPLSPLVLFYFAFASNSFIL